SDPEVPIPARTAPRLSNGHAHQITSQLTQQLPGTLARLEADVAALRKAVEGDRRILDSSYRDSRETGGRRGGSQEGGRGRPQDTRRECHTDGVLEQLAGTLARLEADVAALRKAVEGDRRILDIVLEQLPGTLARLEADVAALRKAVEGDRRILDVSVTQIVLEQLPGTLARLEADVAALRKAVEGDRRILDIHEALSAQHVSTDYFKSSAFRTQRVKIKDKDKDKDKDNLFA
ncbi:Uncharacterized protein OBRU01_21816, partial [Operophtera brumata]